MPAGGTGAPTDITARRGVSLAENDEWWQCSFHVDQYTCRVVVHVSRRGGAGRRTPVLSRWQSIQVTTTHLRYLHCARYSRRHTDWPTAPAQMITVDNIASLRRRTGLEKSWFKKNNNKIRFFWFKSEFFGFFKKSYFRNFQFILYCKALINSQDCGKSLKHCELHIAQNIKFPNQWLYKISRRRVE